jgi:hypothetical protein
VRLLLRLVGALLGLGCERAVRLLLERGAPFDAAAAPAPSDYREPAVLSALPERADAADASFVHPTSDVGADWNGAVDDPRLNADTDAASA